MNALNDTFRSGAAVDRGPHSYATPPSDLAPHILRIVRRAMLSGETSPLARAIRSAVAQVEPSDDGGSASDDPRVRAVAGRLTAVLASRQAVGRDVRHRETIRH